MWGWRGWACWMRGRAGGEQMGPPASHLLDQPLHRGGARGKQMGWPVPHLLGQPLHLSARQTSDCQDMCVMKQKLHECCNEGRHFKVKDLPGHYAKLQLSSFDRQLHLTATVHVLQVWMMD